MELRHLRYFLAVADELHFGRAAALLHISQPPLSQQIRQLEQEMGVELFARTNRRVRLTEAGQAFLPEARALLERLEVATATARRVARGETGTLSVGFIASATYGLLPRLYRRFCQRYPDITLLLSELSTAEQVAALHAGQLHVGLARAPVGDETLLAEPLAEEPLLAALPSGHPLAARTSLALRDLAGEPFVLFPRRPRPGWIDVVQGACLAAGFRPSVVQEALELSTAVTLVAAGIGVTLVPAPAEALQLEGVAYRPLQPPVPTTQLLALHRADARSPSACRFLEVAREVLAAAPLAPPHRAPGSAHPRDGRSWKTSPPRRGG